MKLTLGLKDTDCEIIPVSGESVKLMIHIEEQDQPVIFSIAISGNRYLPFGLIYQLLGLRPSDRLDVNDLNKRIMRIYGLGYFENIRYEIEPRGQNRVHLQVIVKEHNRRKLRLGLRYDNNYRLVASLAVQGTNFLIPGLRYKHELQLAGLIHYQFKMVYPSATLNLPIYPYLRFEAKDIPIHIYDLYLGNKIARYRARSLSSGAGLGFLFGRACNLEIGYEIEQMDVKPNVAFSDPVKFPVWDEKLQKVKATLIYDHLDNVSTPSRGAYLSARYEGSYSRLDSEHPFEQAELFVDLYTTLLKRHTFRLYGFTGTGHSLPIYKTPNQGHPSVFVGMDYDQLFGSKLSVLRTDYRYQVHTGLYLKLIFNTAFHITQETEFYTVNPENVIGMGVGMKLVSPIGPVELILSRGSKHFGGNGEMQNVFYFTFGSTVDKFLFQ